MDDRATPEDGDFIWKYFTFLWRLCCVVQQTKCLPRQKRTKSLCKINHPIEVIWRKKIYSETFMVKYCRNTVKFWQLQMPVFYRKLDFLIRSTESAIKVPSKNTTFKPTRYHLFEQGSENCVVHLYSNVQQGYETF